MLNAILLRPLPLDNPATLASVSTADSRSPGLLGCSYLNYKDYRDRNGVFSALALYAPITVNLTAPATPGSGSAVVARSIGGRWRSRGP